MKTVLPLKVDCSKSTPKSKSRLLLFMVAFNILEVVVFNSTLYIKCLILNVCILNVVIVNVFIVILLSRMI